MKRLAAPVTASVCAVLSVSAAPMEVPLASNRAIYDISLAQTTGGVVAAHGRMAIEFRDRCSGWSTMQRMILDQSGSNGAPSRTDFFVTAWESKDGHTMRFSVGHSENGKAREHERGAATLTSDGSGRTELVEGKPANFMLPRPTEFPTTQIRAILRAAMQGGSSFKDYVFQGGNNDDRNFSVARIGKRGAELAGDRTADSQGLLKNVAQWPVLIGFFPSVARGETPDYEIATHLYANGINGSMDIVYPDYTLRATLVKLEPLPPRC